VRAHEERGIGDDVKKSLSSYHSELTMITEKSVG